MIVRVESVKFDDFESGITSKLWLTLTNVCSYGVKVVCAKVIKDELLVVSNIVWDCIHDKTTRTIDRM